MSGVRHLLTVGCRSRSLTPTGRGGPVSPAAGRRLSLHASPRDPAGPPPGALQLSVPAPGAGPGARRPRRGSAVSPVALLFRRSPLRPDQPWNRSILPRPSLLVTPGSPPDEIPDPFASGDVRSATCHKTYEDDSATYTAASPASPAPVRLDGEPPPGVPRTPVITGPRRGSWIGAGLKFDTPERTEVEEHGLDSHPDVPVLGRGAFGTVVLGRRRERPVAVKVVRGRPPSAGDLLARRLRHPHLVAVYGVYGVNAAFSTVEMEYCGGASLQALLDAADGPLPAADVARFVTQLVSALAYCHGEGVIHLDLKPANVIVTRAGDLKLGDFGSARSVDDQEARGSGARGTVPYMAPELFRGERATCRADVYALGVCTWQLLSGRRPFAGLQPETVIYIVVALRRRPEPQLSAAAGRWQCVVERCWAQEARSRPDAEQLERWLLALDGDGVWIRDPF
ncbi:serine/threonine-protein kinase mos-like [Amphibalanus amphitrite]|uniref:serine/threonine-protein kinase mos-like n=1 Tax=Amphibalanus amphitrite TaxID=1232801 RepID=UPI001C905F97|nr:serine/threonine-protein kinase mos-like [Amphibalanus amphitrite]